MTVPDDPVVSIVTGAYNASQWIGETLQSVEAQTFRQFEHIVVDDGSTDGTAEIVRGYGGVRLVQKENGGAPSARNAGIAAARGAFVAFLDHDDLWTPDKLERQVALHRAQPDLTWSYTDAVFFDSGTGEDLHRVRDFSTPHSGRVFRPLLLNNFIPFSSSFVRRDLFATYGGLDERPERRHIDDWDLWLRLAADEPLGYVPEPLLRYRWHGEQATQRMNLDDALRHRLDMLGDAVARAGVPHLRGAAQAAAHVAVGRLHLQRGDARRARKVFRAAVRLDPRSRVAWTFLAASLTPRPVRRLARALRPHA